MNRVAVLAAFVVMILSGCTSIITYIKQDNRHDNAYCETDDGSQGLLDISGECTINKPEVKNKEEAT